MAPESSRLRVTFLRPSPEAADPFPERFARFIGCGGGRDTSVAQAARVHLREAAPHLGTLAPHRPEDGQALPQGLARHRGRGVEVGWSGKTVAGLIAHGALLGRGGAPNMCSALRSLNYIRGN